MKKPATGTAAAVAKSRPAKPTAATTSPSSDDQIIVFYRGLIFTPQGETERRMLQELQHAFPEAGTPRDEVSACSLVRGERHFLR